MSKPKYNFYADLKFGREAEQKFLEKYAEFLDSTDGREGDFIIKGTKLKIELKVDRYCADRWPNFVMEKYRSGKKTGGPFQALEHGCRYLAYYFAKNDRLFLFDTYQLCRRIEMLVKKRGFKLETISNGSYETSFYRIPRTEFEDIALPFFETVERKFKLAKARADKKEGGKNMKK